ncbi:aldo/keto reductase [Gemmobacter lanyuensis]
MPYDLALAVVDEIRALVPQGLPMAQFALRWILMEEAVSVVIPGAKTAAQATANAQAADLAPCRPKSWPSCADFIRRGSRPMFTSFGE